LKISTYNKGDWSGFTTGICDEEIAKTQKDKTTFDFSGDISHAKFYGISGLESYGLGMDVKEKYVSLKVGDTLDFKLDLCNTGLFTISRDGVVLKEKTLEKGN